MKDIKKKDSPTKSIVVHCQENLYGTNVSYDLRYIQNILDPIRSLFILNKGNA